LFESICNNNLFRKSSLILFLNMKDLFEQKIQVKRIRDVSHFQDYKGPDNDYEAGQCVVRYTDSCEMLYAMADTAL
jgi:hypothetical protein